MRIDSQRIDMTAQALAATGGIDLTGDIFAKEAFSTQAKIIKKVLVDAIRDANENTSLIAKLTGKNFIDTAKIVKELARLRNKYDPYSKEMYYPSYVDKAISDFSKINKATVNTVSQYVDVVVNMEYSVNVLNVKPSDRSYNARLPDMIDAEQKILDRGVADTTTWLTNEKVRKGTVVASMVVAGAVASGFLASELQNHGLFSNPFSSVSLNHTIAQGINGSVNEPTLRLAREDGFYTYKIQEPPIFTFASKSKMTDNLMFSIDLAMKNGRIDKSRIAELNVMKIDEAAEINALLKMLKDNNAFTLDEKSLVTERLLKKDFAFFERMLKSEGGSKNAFYTEVVQLGNEIEASKLFATKLEEVVLGKFVKEFNNQLPRYDANTIKLSYVSYLEGIKKELNPLSTSTTFADLNRELDRIYIKIDREGLVSKSIGLEAASMHGSSVETIDDYANKRFDLGSKERSQFIEDTDRAKALKYSLDM